MQRDETKFEAKGEMFYCVILSMHIKWVEYRHCLYYGRDGWGDSVWVEYRHCIY